MSIRNIKISIVLIVAILLSMTATTAFAYNTGDDYPTKYKTAAKDSLVDEWNFYNRECTSFVAWCLNSRNGVAFTNQYGGVSRWGNAKTWGTVAQSIGISVNSTPAIGAVAWWNTGTYGHVAWVKSINGNTITIDEYNHGVSGGYGERTISSSAVTGGFIHIKDINVPDICTCSTSYAGNYTCTSNTSLKIRSGHGSSFSEVNSSVRIPSGATVYVSQASGTGENDWGHVTYDGVSGYASMAYLSAAKDSYVNLGAQFYAVILHKDSWKPLTYDSDDHVRLHAETGTASQTWLFTRQSDGSYTIASSSDGDLLELWEGNMANNTPLVVGIKDWGSDYQRWYIYGDYNSGYIIKSKHNQDVGRVITVQDSNPYDGVEIQTCEQSNARTQIFMIYTNQVSLIAPTLSVQTEEGKAAFEWSQVYGESAYDLHIQKDGNDYKTVRVKANTTSYTQELPAGTYTATVRSVNAFAQKESNSVSFTIDGPLDKGSEFYAVILHTDSWKPLTYDSDNHVRLHAESGVASQVWQFKQQDDGSYTIASAKDGNLLEMQEGNTENNTPLVVGTKDQGSEYQRWYIYGDYDSGYYIKSKYKQELRRVFTTQDADPSDGTEVQTCEKSNARTQFFSIYTHQIKLSAPTLSVKTEEGKANFEWSKTYGEASYELCIKKDDTDYKIVQLEANTTSYTQELPAGTYSASVRAINAFEQVESDSVSFTVEGGVTTKNISSSVISLSYANTVYDGQAKQPKVTVTDGKTVLTEGTDYKVAYSNNVNAGTATITITGQDTYTGTVKKTFTITKASQTVAVQPSESTVAIGKSVQVKSTTNGDGTVQYKSKDSGIATVSKTGLVTGISAGQTTISVTAAETENYLPASKDITITVEEVSSPSEATIQVSSVKGLPGQTVSVPVSLENNPGIVSMLVSVTYDRDVLTLVGVEDAGLLGTAEHNPSYSAFPYILSWSNDTAKENFTVNGTIVTLVFQIKEEAEEGSYPVAISYDADKDPIFDQDMNPVNFAIKNGKIDVTTVLLGDVNGDGKVTAIDRACLARYLAGWEGYDADSLVLAAMDVNADGKITALDRAVLARHLAGWDGYESLPYTK